MKLDLCTVKSITVGAETVRELNGEFVFDRFTEEQLRCYEEYRDEGHFKNALTSAGIRLCFETDSDNFSFTYNHTNEHSIGMAYLEVHINGELDSFFVLDLKQKNAQASVKLPGGTNKIDLYLPYKKSVSLCDVTLDDGASVTPIKRSKTMISYGDSITHGSNCQLSSNTYAARIAKMLDADACNKGVGGDRFLPELLMLDEPIKPDIVTVAYGTNDWAAHSRETVARRSRDFIVRASEKYPLAKIFVISPIWRAKNFGANKFNGPTEDIHAIMEKSCEGLKNVILINGRALVPVDPTLFADGLHPNELGMKAYADALYSEIKKYI